MQNLYLSITDTTWINFIKNNKDNLGKYINFWRPGGKAFKALKQGELFLFKLHSKKDKGENGEIVGGAYYYGFEKMSPNEAWNRFGIGNGASTLFEKCSLINEYRTRNNLKDIDEIGCIILYEPFFFDKESWIDSPVDFGKSIVSGKKYDISFGVGKEIYEKVLCILTSKNEKREIDINDAIEQFENEKMIEVRHRIDGSEKLRKKFVSDFPIDNILNMTMDEFLIARKGCGNDSSFCRRIRYELEGLAHMGNAFPQVFGMFLKDGISIEMSTVLKKEFGDDIDVAFQSIKKQIVNLLIAARENNYEVISNSKLNSLFKYKLLIIYYPNQYFPVCAKKTLDEYCNIVGLRFADNVDMIYKNISLLEWKNTHYPFCEWSNALFMLFCDWIWRENRKLNLTNLKKKNFIDVKKIEKQLNELNLNGDDKVSLVKVRVNQGIFRTKLLERYKKCCLCQVQNKELLVASHIKPWSECEASEKLDVNNGFLMCPNHDKLFDQGWISFDNTGRIIISKQLELVDRINMKVIDSMKIAITEENREYLKYHRENIFKK